MKRITLLIFLISLIQVVSAQKADLVSLCTEYEKLFDTHKNVHLPYVLTVASSLDTTVERMPFDLYKSADKDYMKMGDKQVVIHDGTLLLAVNNEMRTIRISNDSANIGNKNIPVSSFSPLIDSSVAIQFSNKDNLLSYTLTFPVDFVYERLNLVFSKKTKHLLRMYALYSADYPSEFKYIEVVYQEPDFKWVPEAGFPGTETYITQLNGYYRVQEAFDSYKIY